MRALSRVFACGVGARSAAGSRASPAAVDTQIWLEARALLNLSPPRYNATRRPFGADSPVDRARVHSAFFLSLSLFFSQKPNDSAPTLLPLSRSPLPLSLLETTERKRGATGRSRRRTDLRRAEGRTAEARESCARPHARLTARTTGTRDTMGGRNRRRRPSTTDVSSVCLDGIL